MALLSAHGLTRAPWFSDWDLEIEAGQLVVLTGPSGSGKTLLLRTLADLDPADAGRVSLAGTERMRFSAPQWRRQILYVHPAPPRFPGTVADNLAEIRELHGGSTPPPLDGLPALDAELDAGRLSSGEGQLLALHRALLVAPTILLLDEATASLDPDRAASAEQSLSTWARSGERAILWVSHDRGLAERLGARTVSFP